MKDDAEKEAIEDGGLGEPSPLGTKINQDHNDQAMDEETVDIDIDHVDKSGEGAQEMLIISTNITERTPAAVRKTHPPVSCYHFTFANGIFAFICRALLLLLCFLHLSIEYTYNVRNGRKSWILHAFIKYLQFNVESC